MLHWQEFKHHWSPQRHALHERVCRPERYSQAAPGRSRHPPHEQFDWQTSCEQGSQPPLRVAPGAQAPWPEHGPHAQSLPQVCEPQLPHARRAPGVQPPPPAQAPQEQLLWQLCVPQAPQERACPGEHSPSSEHAPQAQLDAQVCAPHRPQA